MTIRLLGTLEVADGGDPIDIGGPSPRVILAMLVAAEGKVVGVDSLIDAIWDDSPPASASGTLQTYVSRLRRALDRVGGSILREPAGYRLEIDRDAVDAHRFEALADQGRVALDDGDPTTARSSLIEAEQLWRGPALLEVRDRPRVAGIARRLDERRLAAIEDRLAADLALGRHSALVAELTQLVGEHPLREALWELLALARYRSGMQADALRAISEARATLVDALGVDPGAGLRNLEQAILCQDPALDPAPRPTPATDVGQQRTDATTNAPRRPPLIGRVHELARLTEALRDASEGASGIAVVQGEAGVGKTRLVEELAREAERCGGRVVWGRCLEGGAAPAYWPWLGVLRVLRAGGPGNPGDPDDGDPDRGDPDHGEPDGDAVGQLLGATADLVAAPTAGARSRLLEGVLDLLEGDDGHAPLVVVLEDVQWADPESIELAIQVAAGLSTRGVLLTLTLRDGEDARSDAILALLAAVSRRQGTRRLHLHGLAPDETAQLLAQVSGRPIDDSSALAVHDRVEGNPFYAIELQRLLDADEIADPSEAATTVPIGVRDVIRQRMARLPRSTVELLELAAVAGRELDVEVLGLAGSRSIDACVDDLEVALDHGVLVESSHRASLRFSHALVREVVVDDLSALRRARLHLTIADAIEATGRGDEAVEIVAEHLWSATPIGAGRRAAYALGRAAEVAVGRFALGTAGDLLSRAYELRRSSGSDATAAAEELDALLELVWVLRARSGYQGPLAHYRRGAELARRLGRPDVELEMQWGEWAGYDTTCDFERARPIARDFRSWAEEADDPLVQVAGFTAWAIQCWHDGDLRGAAAGFASAAAPRASLRVGERSLAAELIVLSTAFDLYVQEQVGTLVDPDGAFADAASADHSNYPVAVTWSFACTSAMSVGDLDRVERCARRVLEAEAGETLGFWGSQARMYLGAMLVATGRPREGRELFDIGREAYVEAGLRTGLGLMLAAAASAEVAAGDLERAARHLTAAQDELTDGERWPLPFVLLAEADLAEASGAPAVEVTRTRREAEAVAGAQGAAATVRLARSVGAGRRWLAGSAPSPVGHPGPAFVPA